MASLNRVMLMGNLTRDPEQRYTPKGTAVVEIGLAINRRYLVENETKEEVTYVDITFWGRQAETINQYCKKGQPLYVEGRLQLDSWDDKTTGQKRSRLRVVGEGFQFLGQRDSASRQSSSTDSAAAKSAPIVSEPPPFDDDEIPF